MSLRRLGSYTFKVEPPVFAGTPVKLCVDVDGWFDYESAETIVAIGKLHTAMMVWEMYFNGCGNSGVKIDTYAVLKEI